MKTLLVMFAGTGLIWMAFSGSALAQAYVRTRIQTQVPVSFLVANTKLPSGEYTFWVDTTDNRVQVVEDATNRSVFVFGMPAAPSTNGRYNVTLTKPGESYQLAEINGRDFGLDFVRPKGVPYSPFEGIVEGMPFSGSSGASRLATK